MAPPLLDSALDEGEWSVSCPGFFTPEVGAPGIYWVGDWVGPRAGLDSVKKRRISCPCRESNSDHSTCSLVAVSTELSLRHSDATVTS
jgi:hypothetical protein